MLRVVGSLLMGIGAAMLVATTWLLFRLLSVAAAFHAVSSSGSGGLGAVSIGVGVDVLVAAIVGFAGGFWWQFRRAGGRS